MSGSALALWLILLQLAGASVLGLAWAGDRFMIQRSAARRRDVWALAIMLASTLPLARLYLPVPAIELPRALSSSVITLWTIGAVLLVIRWIHGVVVTRRLIAEATPIDAGRWRRSLDALDARSELRAAAGIPGPMVVGWLRPVILIPAELCVAAMSSTAERRAILIHELAHVTRADNLLLHLGVLVRAIYWVTPLAWISLRRLRNHAENAADDAVLEAGATPSGYAAQLVESARTQLHVGLDSLDGSARVSAGQLRARVEAILDGSRRREGVSVRRPSLAVARLLGAAVLLASLATACEARSETGADDREQRDD